MSYRFLVKASDDEFSEVVLKPLEIRHFLGNVGLRTSMYALVCAFDLTELYWFQNVFLHAIDSPTLQETYIDPEG